MTITEPTTSNRPKPTRRAFMPPADGVGVKVVDDAFALAARLNSELAEASRAVDRAERAWKVADANDVDVKDAASAMVAGNPPPPSTLARLKAEWDEARKAHAVLDQAKTYARGNARALLEQNRAEIEKVQAARIAKTMKAVTPALATVSDGIAEIAKARGVLEFLEDPSMYRPALIAVPIGAGEAFAAQPFLAELAHQLG